MSKNTPKIFYVILVLIPVLFFILLEAGLRIFDYGRNTDAFITLNEEYKDLLFTNPDLPFRYMTNMTTAPAVSLDAFTKEKSDSTFRIFVMGGSSTAGFPYAYNVTFPRYIQRKLQLLYPDLNIEVVNLGITAHNSFTIADLADDVIENKPDLVLVYAGHNEYYGILGVASSASFGSSYTVSKMLITLNRIKTYQLLTNIINWFRSSIADNQESSSKDETLMSQMIGESKILYNSDLFNAGIEQFKLNMEEFAGKMKDAGIRTIIGNLACNHKQKPFISVSEGENKNADSLFSLAEKALDEGIINQAGEAFLSAKEYDVLRFRAPEKINETINEIVRKYKCGFINIDSVFSANSPNGIIGYNLMVDHLHPNVEGYNLIGKSFYDEMVKNNFLPVFGKTNLSDAITDSILIANFPYTRLDSVLSDLRIKRLLGSYPFVPKDTPNENIRNFRARDFVDSTAVRMANKEISWRIGHQNVAEWYYNQKNFDGFTKEVDAIIAYQPYTEIAYAFASSRLINAGQLDKASEYLSKLHKMTPTDYTYKWIGSIALGKGEFEKAIKYLKRSIELNDKDAQAYYNLSGAYFNSGNIDEATKSIAKCLQLNSKYPRAAEFYNSLKSLKN